MTCIIGMVSEGRVWMGADSRASYDKGNIHLSLKTPKLHKLGPYLLGSSGLPLMNDVAAYHLKLPEPPKRGLMRFISRKVVPALKEAIKERGNVYGGLPEGQILLGVRGQLFVFDTNTQHYQVRGDYHAIGEGAVPARAALYGMAAVGCNLKAKDRIRIALEAAEDNLTTVAHPWTILSV